jgi:DNA-binding NarL/FixJ family response regulator
MSCLSEVALLYDTHNNNGTPNQDNINKPWYNVVYLCVENRQENRRYINGFKCYTFPNIIQANKYLDKNKEKFIKERNIRYEIIPVCKYIPFILLTTRGLTEDRIKGYNLGCSAYVPKPFDPEELEAIIKNIILKSEVFYDFILAMYIVIKDTRLGILDTYEPSYRNVRLTKQEQFILREILAGKNSLELSLKLKISLRCVEKYVTRILNKTDTRNTMELKRICCSFL